MWNETNSRRAHSWFSRQGSNKNLIHHQVTLSLVPIYVIRHVTSSPCYNFASPNLRHPPSNQHVGSGREKPKPASQSANQPAYLTGRRYMRSKCLNVWRLPAWRGNLPPPHSTRLCYAVSRQCNSFASCLFSLKTIMATRVVNWQVASLLMYFSILSICLCLE